MHLLHDTLASLWKVALVGLLLGAGLPAIFALGLRAMAVGTPREDGTLNRPPVALAAAALCFAVVVVAIVTGILFVMKGFLSTHLGIDIF